MFKKKKFTWRTSKWKKEYLRKITELFYIFYVRLHTKQKSLDRLPFRAKMGKILKAEQEKNLSISWSCIIFIIILNFFHPTRVFTNFMFFLFSNFIFNFLLNCYLWVINVLFWEISFHSFFHFAYLHNTLKYEIHHWTYESRLFHLSRN